MKYLQLWEEQGMMGFYVTCIPDDDTIQSVIDGAKEYIDEKNAAGEDIDDREVFDKLLLKNGIERVTVDDIDTDTNFE
jgi:hypothetical protein